ncbi:MAG: gamma carbonic anhydrase family protein [Gemmatimonadaceae bacterium]|nr:gamma carbonic anhydrase family protein [Gloeobacterales cyanobacterium ES-bin-141]
MNLEDRTFCLTRPDLSLAAFVAPDAVVIGDVRISAGVSIWFGAVVRGDVERIEVGEDTNIQDGAILHGDPDCPVILQERVTVGHRAVIHGATVEARVLIGIGAIILNGAIIGTESIIAAGAVVTRSIPPRSLAAGIPARVLRQVSEAEICERTVHALSYRKLAESYRGVQFRR